jgi:hypothetical protein
VQGDAALDICEGYRASAQEDGESPQREGPLEQRATVTLYIAYTADEQVAEEVELEEISCLALSGDLELIEEFEG